MVWDPRVVASVGAGIGPDVGAAWNQRGGRGWQLADRRLYPRRAHTGPGCAAMARHLEVIAQALSHEAVLLRGRRA